mmetsp:Transcript_29/g.56  ORF Transcript_29/g.56 Transcript_29/m.56 type:complete len:85 (-) Transcript_29:1672-1926(-)
MPSYFLSESNSNTWHTWRFRSCVEDGRSVLQTLPAKITPQSLQSTNEYLICNRQTAHVKNPEMTPFFDSQKQPQHYRIKNIATR